MEYLTSIAITKLYPIVCPTHQKKKRLQNWAREKELQPYFQAGSSDQ